MATTIDQLKSMFQKAKKKVLDSTTIDEKIGQGFSSISSYRPQPSSGQQSFMSTARQAAPIAFNAVSRALPYFTNSPQATFQNAQAVSRIPLRTGNTFGKETYNTFSAVPDSMRANLSRTDLPRTPITPLSQKMSGLIGNMATPIASTFANVGGGLSRSASNNPMEKMKGGFQIAKGIGQGVASANPFLYGGIAANQALPQSQAKRLSTGFLQGYTQSNISPETQKNESLNLPFNMGKVDPLMGVGNMVGFVANPTNKQLFKMTEGVLPAKFSIADEGVKKAVGKWLASNATRGSIEQIVLSLPDMPDNLSTQDKAKWLASTMAKGAVSELVGQAAFQGGGKILGGAKTAAGNVLKSTEAAQVFDWLKGQKQEVAKVAQKAMKSIVVEPGYSLTTTDGRIVGGLTKPEMAEWIARFNQDKVDYKVGFNETRTMAKVPGFFAGSAAVDFKPDAPGTFSNLMDKKPRLEVDDSGAKLKLPDKVSDSETQSLSKILESDKELELSRKLTGFTGTLDQYKKAVTKKLYDKSYDLSRNDHRLGDILDHKALYEKYPGLADIKVSISGDSPMMPRGSFNPDNKSITLSKASLTDKSTLLHEIQHAIQEIEGFARGGSPETIKRAMDDIVPLSRARAAREYYDQARQINPNGDIRTLLKQADELYQKKFGASDKLLEPMGEMTLTKIITSPKEMLDKQIADNLARYGISPQDLTKNKSYFPNEKSFELYKRYAGELEARAVQRRMNMPQSQRLTTDPYSAEAIATTGTTNPNDFITRFDSGTQASVDPSAKVGGVDTVSFKEPYQRGDIGKLQQALDDVLGTNSFKNSGKWQADYAARNTAKQQLEYDAQSIPEARQLLDYVNKLEGQIEQAQGLKGTPQVKPEISPVSAQKQPEITAHPFTTDVGKQVAQVVSTPEGKMIRINATAEPSRIALNKVQQGLETQTPTLRPSATSDSLGKIGASQTGKQVIPLQTQRTLSEKIPLIQKPQVQDSQLSGQSQILSSGDIIQQAKAEIGKLNEEPKKSVKQIADDLYTQWVNRYAPIERLADKAKIQLRTKGAELRPEADPSFTLRRLTGAGGIADTRYQTELKPIISQMDELNIPKDEMDVYLKARRDIGLSERGIKGSDKLVAQQRIAALEQKYPEISQFSSKLYEYQNKGFQEMIDSGFLSKENAALIRQQNPDYVPFQRVMDQMDEYLGLPTRKAMQGTQPIAKIKGSDKQVYSPLESIIANTFKQRGAIEKNNVAKSIVNLQEVADLGIKKVSKADTDTITVWNNGNKEYYSVGEGIADTVKGLNEENTNTLLKIFQAPAALLRQGATGRNPDFMIPNIVRDQMDAAITSKYGYIPVVDYFSGLKSMLKNDDIYQKWERSGAKIDLGEMSGRKSIQESFDKAKAKKSLFSWLGDKLDVMGKYSEQPTRVGLFKKAYQKTGSESLAMMDSRDATVDFARMGSKMKVANSIIPFLNVGIQGFDKLIRAAKDNPGKVAFNMTAYGVLPAASIAAYNLLNFPSEYAEIPQYEKDSNFVLVSGRNDDGTVNFMTIPKGNILPLVANPTESLLSYVFSQNKQSFGEFATQFISGALPVVGDGGSIKEVALKTIGSNLPQMIKPITENLINKSFYKYNTDSEQAKDIVPAYLNKKEPYQRAYEWTPATYKVIGRVLNVSPLQVQNLMDGYLAGYAKVPSNIIDSLIKISDGDTPDSNTIPIVRRFVKTTFPTSTKKSTDSTKEKSSLMDRITGKAAAADGSQETLPTSSEDLYTLYKDATSTVNKYRDNKIKSEQGLVNKSVEEYQSELDDAIKLKKQIEQKNPNILSDYYLKDIPEKSSSKYETSIREKALFSRISDVKGSESLSKQQKQDVIDTLVQEAGYTKDEYEYYTVASENNDTKTLYVQDKLDSMKDKKQMLQFLIEGRKNVRGSLLASDGVLQNLEDDGYITDAERRELKSYKYDKSSKKVSKSKGKSKKIKLGTTPTYKRVNIKAPQVAQMAKINFNIPSTSRVPVKRASTTKKPRINLNTASKQLLSVVR